MLKGSISTLIAVMVFAASVVFASSIEGCTEYSKIGLPGNQGELLCRKGYLLAHDSNRKTPIWVIEHLTADKANGTILRNNKFKPDPDLDEGKRAELDDYRRSGYDKGHMAPAADMRWDKQAMEECFYLSNMVPQVGVGMNQGIWKDLEEYVRDWAIARGEVYIFTGPIYDGGVKKTVGPGKVAVPTHLYKIVYDPYKTEAIAFIMSNQKIDSAEMPNYIVTIRDIEKKTGLDFLSNLDKDVQDVIENKKPDGLWQ
ncbi:MAG: DNA/RNA non-specific endonuclease [Geobacter sp.]|nr:MAG: DNA/RNA non-specific endonuclease [Geobacter sp.]